MKMLLLVFRASMEKDVLHLLNEQEITAFTAIPTVLGSGESGKAFGTMSSQGTNSLIFIVLEEEKATRLQEAIQRRHQEWEDSQQGGRVPLHLFSLHCEQIV